MNAPAWGDGAGKRRWFLLPGGATVQWRETESWEFPVGTVLVKEFLREGRPIETRFLVRRDARGAATDWEPTTYAWRGDGTDAHLVPPEGLITNARGGRHVYPSRFECKRCHAGSKGGPLGLETANVHRGTQLEDMNALGLFGTTFPGFARPLPQMPDTSDADVASPRRARAWLHANCVHCHRRGGEMGGRAWGPWDLPLADTDLCDVIIPQDPGASALIQRVYSSENPMPPIATLTHDPLGVSLLFSWIQEMKDCP